ncbi:AraC family transcriptional regulator [Streptomyces sp. NPDC087440]|uniref:AraC family transcriptional regulator n=1 Tax=Streptomyces sp. NPDC087440 TaxID=3365790 RepID=UPI003829910E
MHTFRSADLDETRRAIGESFYTTRIDPLGEPGVFESRIDTAQVGSLTVGDLVLGADLRMRFGELGHYHVNVLLGGTLAWRQRGRAEAVATPQRGCVLDPESVTRIDHWSRDCRLLALKIEPDALHRQLELLLDRSLRGPVDFVPDIDVSRGAGRSWARLMSWAVEEARDTEGLPGHAVMAAPLQEALLNGLLLAADHPYREELAAPAPPLRPAPVKRVLDLIHAHPEHAHTAASLAAVAQVGVRRLQEGFREHLGTTPTAYLRGIRLDRVRADLARAARDGAAGTTVADVAFRWGFGHLGRFAAAYRARFGESPSHTLRHPGSSRDDVRPGSPRKADEGRAERIVPFRRAL